MKRAWMSLCICAIMGCAFGKAEGAEVIPADSAAVRREVQLWTEGRWAVVNVREVKGKLMVVREAVGREIDLAACHRFGLFQGETAQNKTWRLPTVTQPIVGFQSAVFLQLPNGEYGVRIAVRNEAGLQCQFLRLNREELAHLGTYLDQIAGTPNEAGVYPLVTDEEVAFETRTLRYMPTDHQRGGLGLMSGEHLRGRLLPVMEDGQMLIETPLGFRRVEVEEIVRIEIGGQGGAGIVQKTLRGGMTYALIGGWTGLLIGLGEGASIRDEMLFGATLGGTLGATFGFLDGLFSIQPARTFHLDAPQGQPERKIELSPIRIRVRF